MDVKEKNNTEKTNAAAGGALAEDLNEVMRIRPRKAGGSLLPKEKIPLKSQNFPKRTIPPT